jgi:uncharacterized SAM-binding protein YcdF (DUF218 family)
MHGLGLQKLLGCLFMPSGMVWLGLLIATIWAWKRKLGGLRVLLMALFLLDTLAGNRWVGTLLLRRLESRIPALDRNAAPFDAICVLGGGSDLDRQGKPQLEAAGDRIAAAARLYHEGRARTLVASGCSDDDLSGSRNLGQETRQLWLGMGIPSEAILVVDRPCRITREEIAAYREMQKAHDWRRVGLLSSAWHLPRAMTLASRTELMVTPIPADSRSRERRFQIQYLIPQERGFTYVHLACWEYLGRWVGR